MALPRREFLDSMTPEILSDLRKAARHLMAQVCDHHPEDCNCELNRFTPDEFVDWLEDEAALERRKPRTIPAGRPGAHEAADRRRLEWNLSQAG